MGHDLGHPPFGHNGEGALSDYHGGFWHNRQSVRVARVIENLNLTHETLNGIAKHTGKDQPETLKDRLSKRRIVWPTWLMTLMTPFGQG